MNKQIRIATFHEVLSSDEEGGTLFDILRKLTEVKETKVFTEAKGAQPLGFWAGWPMA